MFGTLLNQSGIRCYKRLNEEQAKQSKSDISWVSEEVMQKIDGEMKKVLINVAYAALPVIKFDQTKTLEECIVQITENEDYPNSRCLTKNERGQWALIEVGERRLFIANSIISDK